jgi:CHAT domain-containing protein
LMALHARQGAVSTAVFHGKRAANLTQAVRASLGDKSPSREARRAFLRERRAVYVALAQLLLDAQRLQEAESVLQLLKEDEGQQFLDDRAGADLGRVALTDAEAAVQRQEDASSQQLRQAEQARVDAVKNMPIGGNALLMANLAQIESARLRLGLMLPTLAERSRQDPLRLPANDPAGQAMARDYQDFFAGPGARVDRFLQHLIEDAPSFDPPVSAQDRAQLADILQRLPRIKADVVPMTKGILVGTDQALSVPLRAPGQPKQEAEMHASSYSAAEPAERLWRGIRQGDAIEAQQLRREIEPELRSHATSAKAGSTRLPGDTVALLSSQAVPTALLYYLPGDSRLDVLLVTAAGRRHVKLDVSRDALDTDIEAFTAVLRQPDRDPRPAARAMYRRLFAPVEDAVEQSGARVLALSLAGKLRFVPFAALHGDRGWLVERYALATHPGGQLTGRLAPASANWRVAAFGVSAGGGEFAPLPGVRAEVAGIVRQRDAGAGVLPGEAWVDRDFTAERLRAALGSGSQVLHIASHFKFVGGDAQASYLLLGDGGKLSLRELAGPGYRLEKTELVTLSACSTGVSADDAYGQEVDGLASLLMGQGASAVLASMWEVNDRSTAMLMASMYRLRESRKFSRAIALQQAQLAMIGADASAATAVADTRAVSRVKLPGDPEPDARDGQASTSLGMAHPFHWAAFVLMGNWL